MEFPLSGPRLVQPFSLAAGWDDRMWFTPFSRYVGSITTAGVTASYRLRVRSAAMDHATSIMRGPDDNMWFTNCYGGQIGKIDHQNRVTLYMPSTPYGFGWTVQMIVGPRHHLWLLEAGTMYGALVELDMEARVLKTIPLGDYQGGFYCYPETFAEGAHETLWVGDSASCPKILRVTSDGKVTAFPISSANGVFGMATGRSGEVWFTAGGGTATPYAYIGKIAPNGKMTTYPISPTSPPSSTVDPIADSLTLGPDGNMWFTQPFIGQIGNITPQGAVTDYLLPGAIYGSEDFQVAGIVTGPDRNIWFAQPRSNQIGEFVLGPSPHFATPSNLGHASKRMSASLSNL